ncbi:hypothetical protein BJ912DRAFT_929816 [Pholiota molesta]|nr:hypothetical protein BJ912DRAFT_929816 [Pholiota molesta]
MSIHLVHDLLSSTICLPATRGGERQGYTGVKRPSWVTKRNYFVSRRSVQPIARLTQSKHGDSARFSSPSNTLPNTQPKVSGTTHSPPKGTWINVQAEAAWICAYAAKNLRTNTWFIEYRQRQRYQLDEKPARA